MPEVNAQKKIDPVFTDADKTAWVFTNLIFNTIRYFTKIRLLKLVYHRFRKTYFFRLKIKVKVSHRNTFLKYLTVILEFQVVKDKVTGLSISKEFIDTLGGNISVKSDLASESNFTVSL